MSHFSYLQREKPILSNKTCHSLKWKFFPLLEKPLKHTHTPFNDSWHTLQSNLQNFKRHFLRRDKVMHHVLEPQLLRGWALFVVNMTVFCMNNHISCTHVEQIHDQISACSCEKNSMFYAQIPINVTSFIFSHENDWTVLSTSFYAFHEKYS